MGSQINDELRSLRRQVADLQAEVARVPVRWPNGGGRPKAVIYARVNEAAGVADTDTTFDFDGATSIVGDAPSGGSGTAQNDLGNTYADNEKIRLWQGDDGEWYPDKTGGTAAEGVIYFELIELSDLPDVAALAKPVDENDALDSGADSFYVLDSQTSPQRFLGRGAVGVLTGYRGYATKIIDDYLSTGKPAYRIIDMEGPRRFLAVTTSATYSLSGTSCNIDSTVFDHGDGIRLPTTVTTLTAYDPYGVATGTPSGTAWWLLHDATNNRYIFWQRIVPSTGTVMIHGRAQVDFTTANPAVNVIVDRASGDNPPAVGAVVSCSNPADALNPIASRYQFCGNADGFVRATKFGATYWLDHVEEPTLVSNLFS